MKWHGYAKVIHKPLFSGILAFVAQRIEHLTTDQKVGGSSPSKRTLFLTSTLLLDDYRLPGDLNPYEE